MKNLLFLFAFTLFFGAAFSQSTPITNDSPLYLRFPTIPEFTVYKASDSTTFTRDDLKKNKPTVFIIFSPECEHCQHETDALIKDIKKFKNTQILMITWLPYSEMVEFYKKYKIANYPNIMMARDTKFFFLPYFKVRNLPSIYIYDKSGKFKKTFEGSVAMDEILSFL